MNTIRHVLIVSLMIVAPLAVEAKMRITTENGSVISGDLLSLDHGTYKVKTDYGTVDIPASSVRTIADEAPPTTPTSPTPTSPTTSAAVTPGGGPLRLAGSTTVGDDLAPALLEGYASQKGASDITWTQEGSSAEQAMEGKGTQNQTFLAHLSRHGSGTAFTALADAKTDIGMASRRINPQEASKLSAAGLGDFTQAGLENVLALDGLVVVVNRANPLDSLSIAQIKDLFTGKITDWSQIGGKAGPVALYGRDSKSGTGDTFNALVLGGAPVGSAVVALQEAEEIALKVQADPNAVGYTGIAFLGGNKAVNIVTDCGIQYQASDLFVRMEEYPLSRRLYLYTPGNPSNPDARPFINYALSDKGQDLAKKKNFIDLIPQLAPVTYARNRIAVDSVGVLNDTGADQSDIAGFKTYSRYALNGNRISTTFRFQFGSSDLDARAARDIDRLAAFLKSAPAANRNLLVAGFSDSVGASNRNRKLSEQRARSIAGLLKEKGVSVNEAIGFGRVAPVACNTTPEGREKNRRVEVWLH